MIGNRVMLDTTVLKIAQHLLVAMGAMHKAGLAHCDIKPANSELRLQSETLVF